MFLGVNLGDILAEVLADEIFTAARITRIPVKSLDLFTAESSSRPENSLGEILDGF